MRLGTNALIIKGGCVLAVEINDENGLHYNLPGGGVEEGETVHEALKRELIEETSVREVSIERLVLVWEYTPTDAHAPYGKTHKIHMVFEVKTNQEPKFPENPDKNHTSLKWLPLSELSTLPLIPNLSIINDLLEKPRDTFFLKV